MKVSIIVGCLVFASVAGFAQSSSVVQKALEESPLFEDVQFSSPVVRDASGRDRFSIKAALGSTP